MTRLSVLDIGAPDHIIELLPALERYGYKRYWATEHHSATQSSSPTLMAALAAGITDTIRVGTAAVFLQWASPRRVAEDFRLLELFFPGRVDLGVSGGTVDDDQLRKQLLDGRPEPEPQTFASKLHELLRLFEDPQVGPRGGTPEMWVVGLSERSAALAGSLGVSYCTSEYLRALRGDAIDGAAIARSYRDALGASERRANLGVSCYGICAETPGAAERYWQRISDATHTATGALPDAKPTFIGTPRQCREQLLEVQNAYGADELVVHCFAGELEARLESYALLGQELNRGSLAA